VDDWLLHRETENSSRAQGPLVGCRLGWDGERIVSIRYQDGAGP